MTLQEALDKLLHSFQRYYNIKREGVEAPFAAEALFQSHNEQYFLLKSARISEMNDKETIYFYTADTLTAEELKNLDAIAWERGLQDLQLNSNHHSTNVALIILADKIEADVFHLAKKLAHSKSYRFGIHGFSNYRLIAVELSTGKMAHNRQGQDLKKLLSNIF